MANTGYRINIYIDVNPNSPTFNTTREERVRDDVECGVASASWEVVASYCELDDEGMNTGYYITTEMDMNVESSTYGETRNNRVQNLAECPLPSRDPEWTFDMEDTYCEEKFFPKSGLYGQTGRLHAIVTDENLYSPTYGNTEERFLTKNDWTSDMQSEYGDFPCEAVDTEPQLEVISEACETVTDEYGTLVYNGYKNVTGIDKNPYSDTYLETVTQRVLDTVKCPAAESAIFEFKDGMETGLTNKDIRVEWYKREYTVYVTSSRGSGILPYSVQIPNASWMSYSKPTEDALIFTIEKNMNTSERSQTVTMIQERTSLECKINFTQETPPYYFYLGSNVTAQTVSVGSSSTNQTVSITSLWGDEYKEYNVAGVPTWASYTRSSANRTITFTFQANETTSSRSATVTLTQQTSGKQCVITLSQSAYVPQPSDYVFAVQDGFMWKQSIDLIFDENGSNKYVDVQSNNGFGSDVMWGYVFDSGESWINVIKTGNTLRVYPDVNTSMATRSGTVRLIQDGSNKECFINVTQGGKEYIAYSFQVSSAQSGTYVSELTFDLRDVSEIRSVYVKSSSSKDGNIGWNAKVTSGDGWLTIAGKQTDNFALQTQTNTSSDSRKGTITLTQDESNENCYIYINQNGKKEDENTPEYIQTYGEKFSYGESGIYEFSQLWVSCDIYTVYEGFYNAGSETQNSGDVYVLEKFVDSHDYIEFRVYARDPGINGIEFYFGEFKFKYTDDSDFQVRTGVAGKVNGKNINVRVTRINEIPMALSEVEETE